VTGGGSGIGYGLVYEFIKRGCPKVLITGRRENVLQAAAAKHQGKIFYKVSDAGKATDRVDLLKWVETEHPDCNALVNNAGVMRCIAPVEDNGSWEERAAEIEINLGGPVHLCTLFIPYLLKKKETALIANVTSGLAFVPYAAGPVYSATKFALHSYTMSMRYSLQDTNVRMIEIIPPAVKSNLGGSHDFGEECDEFCEHVMKRVEAGEEEVGFNISEKARLAGRKVLDEMMVTLAQNMHVKKYPA
jgi:uncharacterized oxidoreductase